MNPNLHGDRREFTREGQSILEVESRLCPDQARRRLGGDQEHAVGTGRAENRKVITFSARLPGQTPRTGALEEGQSQIEAENVSAGQQAQKKATLGDISKCPDCYGTGMWYPEGFDKGVARCRHEKLTAGGPRRAD